MPDATALPPAAKSEASALFRACTHMCTVAYTPVYACPGQTEAKAHTHVNTLGLLLPCPPPRPSHWHHSSVTAQSSYPKLAPAWLRAWPEGPSPRGGSVPSPLEPTASPPALAGRPQLRAARAGQGRGTSPPAPGRHVPHPQLTLWLEAFGSPKWGAHDVQSWGRRGSEWAPLCQPGSGQAGRTLRPDAMEKEITASAGPGPLPSYSSRRAGGQGVIKGGLGLPCASGPKGNLLNVAPAPQVI